MKTLLIQLAYWLTLNLAVIFIGYLFQKRKAVLLSWITLLLSLAIIYLIFLDANPVIRMLTLISTTFNCMKTIAATEEYKKRPSNLNLKQWLLFTCCWAGMRAQPFENIDSKPLPCAWNMIWFGISRGIAGAILVFSAHYVLLLPISIFATYILISAVLLVGLSLILHFGMLNISAGTLRLKGIASYPLFRQPARALSLTEFWSKRWNLAFSEMTSLTIFRPLKSKTGSAVALMASFIFSGFLHELALSVPVNGGYGLPTLYFVLQGLLVLIEKALSNNGILFLKNKFIARVWVFLWLVVPAPLLFHAKFIDQVVWPLVYLHF